MSECIVRLHPGREGPVVAGHPWIFAGAVDGLPSAIPPGSLVAVHAADGTFLGRGYVNPRCTIAVRLLTTRDEPIDANFFQRRVAAAAAMRRALLPPETDAYRLINGEGDFLPGVVADVYGPTVVLQVLTAGAARLVELVAQAIADVVRPVTIYERSGGAVRREEGLEAHTRVVMGEEPAAQLVVREHGLRFAVDVRDGQKTGFFLDQRDNRALVGALAGDRQVLNAFAYTGAFSVYAGAGGARRVVSVESSARALRLAQGNWAANGLPLQRGEFVEADVFRFLRDTDAVFDLSVLDPPALVKRRADVSRGARAYKDLHVWALRRAAPGGFLLTFSCSQHVSLDLFRKIVHGAAADAGRTVQVLRHLGPGGDHPVNLAHPEGGYLKGLLLHVQ